jgi:hypothetical protein
MPDRLALSSVSAPSFAARRVVSVIVSLAFFAGSAMAAGATTTTPSDPFSSAMGKIQELCKTFPAACPAAAPATGSSSHSGGSAGSSPGGSRSDSWYYCSSPAGYYPYVRNCAHWQTVPTAPPGMH